MSRKPHYFMIGLFVLAGMTLGVGALVVLSADALREPEQFIETYVDESIQGIEVGTPFKFRGVKVGNVSEISVVSMEYETQKMYIMIRVALNEDRLAGMKGAVPERIQEEVARGLRLKIVPMGITGLSFLEGDYFPEDTMPSLEVDWTPKTTYIPSSPALMTRLGRSVTRLTQQLDGINIESIGVNVEQLTSHLNASVAHIEEITRSAQQVAGPLFSNIRAASAELPQVATNLSGVVQDSGALVENMDGQVQELMDGVLLVLDDLRDMVRMLRQNPGVLLSAPPKEGE